ncbi:endolytic transglycosylase MltG [Alicyclobacillus cycloheptanicus]|uniref:Endolytic murein transglycosylase n=1 Tax=Alicyclobacillus cycloheptanicus TaxID=1457 RepID=A0ABT9XJM1_9BACL|nr:endolytic transglycosylase MltG [Alicyclobacillus cycloheptanicus]MDQ0190510.1 UPF0755 protein [Alicyclobacillus cycloheptanicus]WDM00728.1 endolytic transglycosylase MltG [Alicyclobacillus cycloheptanicus]
MLQRQPEPADVKHRMLRSRYTRLLALGLLLAAGLIVCWWVRMSTHPAAETGRVARVVVQPGESPKQVARELQSAGLIRNALVFRVYLSVTGQDRRIQAGQYRLPAGASMAQIAHSLQRGVLPAVRVTIPEGFTVTQIADRLAAAGVCSRQAFLQAEEKDSFDEPFLQQLPHRTAVKYRLEGYLFPDTYVLSRGGPAHDAVDAMLLDFQRHLNGPLLQEIARQHRTLADVITEASLIEREALVNRDRPLIASVIANRLRRHMPLAIDATVAYVLGHVDVVTRADTRIHDPYNTYVITGLPPGPIASSGLSSIQAALHPAHTPYLYYVAKNDGSGGSYFATTYAQQLRNERLSQENLERARRAWQERGPEQSA